MKSSDTYRITGISVGALLLAGCSCPSSYRDVTPPYMRRAADVQHLTHCQVQHYGATLLGNSDSAETVRTLLEQGADVRGKLIVNGKVLSGSPINLASTPEVIRALAAAGATPNAQGGKDNSTPLCAALRNGKQDAVMALLAVGADPNLADSQGVPPLVIAAEMGDVQLCEALIGSGARVNDTDKDKGTSPLLAVLQRGGIESHTETKQALVQLLLAAGANPFQADSSGNLPLHLAPACLIPTFLSSGVDVNCRNEKGRTPLFFGGSQQRLELLLRYGADPAARDIEGNSAFDTVTEAGLKSYLLIRGCRSGKAL